VPRTPSRSQLLTSVDDRGSLAALISFISERDGDREVYVIRPDGKGERRLTRGKSADYNGPATPDGKFLLVTSATGGEQHPEEKPEQWFSLVPLAEGADSSRGGGGAKPLGPRRGAMLNPSWSPDGRYLYFESTSDFHDLFRLRRADGALTQLTRNPEGNFAPALSPSGEQLAFVSSRDRVAELYVMPAAGGAARRLTTTVRDEWQPRWSPDGQWLVCGSDRESADRLYVLPVADGPHEKSAAGDDARRLTAAPRDVTLVEEQAAWSPTGRRIAYVARRLNGSSHIEIVELDAAMRPLRTTSVRSPSGRDAAEPSWSPDGRWLAFTLGRGNESQIYAVLTVAAEGAKALAPLPVTAGPGPNWHPQWIAQPTSVASR
jgi:TolB protein